jgi:Tol biopolymer transport system component
MSADGSNVRRLTTAAGYDGGAFFSPDGSKIVYRAYHYTDADGRVDSAALAQYQALLAQRLVRPNKMEIWVMNADGSGQRQVTRLGGANFAPYFTPDGSRIIFSSNYRNPTGPQAQNFDLFLVNLDGTGLEQVTTSPEFDGFPQFSPDGRQLVWASNRHDAKPHETNIFIAEWRE